jgi:hypothetical protein
VGRQDRAAAGPAGNAGAAWAQSSGWPHQLEPASHYLGSRPAGTSATMLDTQSFPRSGPCPHQPTRWRLCSCT